MNSKAATWLILLFCCSVLGVNQWEDPGNYTENNRDPKFFSFFNVIRFRNVACTGTNNLRGTCFARRECANIGGVSSGSCARGWGTCCIIQRTCGDTTSLNCTYFSNTNYPALYTDGGRCTITLRLDLLDFSLAQPDANGNCLDDSMVVTGGASLVPRICGENTGQHVYVDFPPEDSPIQISISTNGAVTFNRKWNIKITQIECASTERAPTGCLMYYTAINGKVMSFNYASAGRGLELPWTRELADLNYGVCIRMAPDYCTIQWSRNSADPYSFTVSGDTGSLSPGDLGANLDVKQGADCTTDFVVIPNPYDTNDIRREN
ncbi:hypothetical protein C0J52_09368 [Blattella germanica]|nr:hypothetical protein C0J52_09368 [Blattella germanica]